MTTSTLFGNDCRCGPMAGIGQSSLEIDLNNCSQEAQGFFQGLWTAIKRPFMDLFSFDAAVGGSWISSTLDKPCESDNQFQARRAEARTRWMSLATDNLSGSDLPAENLVEMDSRYLVRNENYRISVTRGMGQQYVDAEVMRMHNQKMWY
jgi:hypothetical protein